MRTARAAGALSVALLLLVLCLDVWTTSGLVVSILLSVPIALSAFAWSRRLTSGLVWAALAANLVAGGANALADGQLDSVAVLNRLFSTTTCVLVGLLVLRLRETTAQAERLGLQEQRARQERALRELVAGVSDAPSAGALIGRATAGLRALLGARTMTIGTLRHGRLEAPLVHDPADTSADEPLPSEFIVRPNREPPVARVADGTVLVGRWRRRDAPELLVLAHEPQADEALLAEAILALEPVLEQAVLLENLRVQRAELERSGAVIRDLVYAFSHDLRTPLMANVAVMRLALQGAYGDLREDFRRSLANGVSANQDLLDLADKLLVVAKLESGELTLDRASLNLGDLVTRRAEELRPALEARGVRLALDVADDVPVQGSAAELRRVVQNLLDNAGKFAPPGGAVQVRLGTQAHEAVLQVLDQGPGVPPELTGRLFQRFRGAGAGAGSGLGLYLAHSIVVAHGGQLSYRRSDDAQSVFEVRLPLERVPEAAL